MEQHFEVIMKVSVKRNSGLYNHMKSFTCIMSVSNFLHISENVVAKEYIHVTLDSCEENMAEPSKDRKFRYREGRHGSVTPLSL